MCDHLCFVNWIPSHNLIQVVAWIVSIWELPPIQCHCFHHSFVFLQFHSCCYNCCYFAHNYFNSGESFCLFWYPSDLKLWLFSFILLLTYATLMTLVFGVLDSCECGHNDGVCVGMRLWRLLQMLQWALFFMLALGLFLVRELALALLMFHGCM